MKRKLTIEKILSFCLVFMFCTFQQAKAQNQDTVYLKEGLSLQLIRGISETIISTNPVEAAIATNTWKTPRSGDVVTFTNGEKRIWKTIKVNDKGWFADTTVRGGGYLLVTIHLKKKSNMILRLLGNDMVYVNGSPRVGNPYGMSETHQSWENDWDYCTLPVELNPGKNELLFRISRGRLKAMLYHPAKPVSFMHKDATLPDFLVGNKIDSWGGLGVINATSSPLKELFVKAEVGTGQICEEKVSVIQPNTIKKIGFHMQGEPFLAKGSTLVKLTLFSKNATGNQVVDTVSVPIRILLNSENHKETFISQIEGSVQYYSVLPPINYDHNKPTALFLSVHGASVEAINQSGSYFPKTWGIVVSPTNRRPYGFNWEDWGRLDAMEVLALAKKKFNIDENRVYLTGHSMGGHGTWHIGAMYPDQFAAIAPSAGWISFWSYRFRGQTIVDTSAIRKMIRRSTTTSETLDYAENYKQLGVYVIHGEIDDNVRIDQAKMMITQLEKIGHKDFQYHFQPNANHWWDVSPEPGADCVDWPPMFDFFARHSRPLKDRVRQINFLTANPGVSARNNWLCIDAQTEQLKMSEAHITFNPGSSSFVGSTVNVERMAFDLDMLTGSKIVSVNLDSLKIENIQVKEDQKQLWLEKTDGKWNVSSEPSSGMKGAARYGTFKDAFRNRMLFVFGTKGSPAENLWAFNKARYDAEKFWYQGNGAIEIIADTDFKPEADVDRSIVIYGNRNTNSAWTSLLTESPVQVGNDFIMVGTKKIEGKNLSCLFVRPRIGSKVACIAVISGTGVIGMKVTDRLPYMSPGIGLPDCTILNSQVMTKGEEGVLMTGFFGLDWSLEKGEFVWNKSAK
ncbi:MAG: prolyl oligopeptidase family serine peptidase [Bacteroidetes bacterium]|nr:prolyl oligopeptidase family serine peptidase [Bacteroidota bacterium]